MNTNEVKNYCLNLLKENNIVITNKEKEELEIADFYLKNLENEGLQIITYVNTKRCCAKELILLPNQTCPEHRHPNIGDELGKEETFRCRKGIVYLYIEGETTKNIKAKIPNEYYTVFNEIVLEEGEQYTLAPNTLHWFQSGDSGAIVSEFSTNSRDDKDIFTNPNIIRT